MHDGRRTPATKGCDITLMRVASFRCESGAAESEAFVPRAASLCTGSVEPWRQRPAPRITYPP